jgi:hypothetical protein
MGEVVDDPDEREQSAVGRPSRVLVAETVDLADDGTPEKREPAQQQLSLIRVSRGKAQFFVGRHRDKVGRTRQRQP